MASWRMVAQLVVTALVVAVLGGTLPSLAADADPCQDICVANLSSEIYVNAFPCKRQVNNSDFASTVLRTPGEFSPSGAAIQTANVFTFPGLNTQGLSMNRVDYLPRGLVIPHHHPRASELIMVTKGTLIACFITTQQQPNISHVPMINGIEPNLTLFQNVLKPYDTAIFPRGLTHYVYNPRMNETAQYIAAYNSDNHGFAPTAETLFVSHPPIPDHILAETLGISEYEVYHIRKAGGYNSTSPK